MPDVLQSVWTLSIALAVLSLASMTVLIGARLVRWRRDRGLIERRKHLTSELLRYSLSGGLLPVIPVRTRHDRAIAIQTALDAFSILDGEARARMSEALRKVSLDTFMRKSARRGRVPDRIAALEALRLFPDAATYAGLEEAQASPIFRICLAALRTRIELGDLPDLAAVLKLTERPEGGRSLSLFKIVEACVRADLTAALSLLTPPPESRIAQTPSCPPRLAGRGPGAPTYPASQTEAASQTADRRPTHAAQSLPARRGGQEGVYTSAMPERGSLAPHLPAKARIMLLKALGAAGSWAAFRDIGQASLDPDPEVRAAALTALRALAAPAAIPIFIAAARDPDWQVRLKAVEGIGQLGNAQDRSSVEPLLNDPVWWIRFRADEALQRLNGRGPELRLPQDPPKKRRRAPAKAAA